MLRESYPYIHIIPHRFRISCDMLWHYAIFVIVLPRLGYLPSGCSFVIGQLTAYIKATRS